MAGTGGCADLRDHGVAHGRCWRRRPGYALLGRARCVVAERNGSDVSTDERLPFGGLVEADLQPGTRRSSVREAGSGLVATAPAVATMEKIDARGRCRSPRDAHRGARRRGVRFPD